MVAGKYHITAVLENPARVDAGMVPALEGILQRYPYFQGLRAALLWHYKHHKPWLFAHALSVTAAHTSDRGRLYDYLHQSWPEPEPGELITEDEAAAEALTTAGQAPSPQEMDEAPSGTFEAATEEKMTEETSASPTAEAEKTPPAALSYIEWVKYLQQKREPFKRPVSAKKAYQRQLIDRFLAESPKIKPRADQTYQPPPEVMESIKEPKSLMTETLAELYVKQKKYKKAIQAYEILKLKYPEKNRYFAARISEIKNLMNA
jgi:hypothetical protein